MPPRGQLDQISEAIGELKGSVGAIEKYVHEGRHGVNNLSQKVDGLRVSIGKDIAAVEARIEAKVDAFINTTNERLSKLERDAAKDQGARGIVVWLLQSPLVGWIVAGVLGFIALWKKP